MQLTCRNKFVGHQPDLDTFSGTLRCGGNAYRNANVSEQVSKFLVMKVPGSVGRKEAHTWFNTIHFCCAETVGIYQKVITGMMGVATITCLFTIVHHNESHMRKFNSMVTFRAPSSRSRKTGSLLTFLSHSTLAQHQMETNIRRFDNFKCQRCSKDIRGLHKHPGPLPQVLRCECYTTGRSAMMWNRKQKRQRK